jgi:hypothetical protein
MAKRPPLMMSSSRLHAGALALLASLALAAIAATPALASTSSSATTSATTSSATTSSPAPVAFALRPVGATSSILLDTTSGRVIHDQVSVRNLSGHSITVLLAPANIVNASNGNADYVTTPLKATGRWLQLSTKTVHLTAHAVQRVALTITVPKGATGASHYAGVVAINAADLSTVAAHRKVKGREFSFYHINRQALPITIRLPGQLTRSFALRSVKLSVQSAGAGLVLGLLPGGSELIEQTGVKLRVSRGGHTVLTYKSTLGQLFPGHILNFRIPWTTGRPTPGTYDVQGTISPQGVKPIAINRTVTFTAAKAKQLTKQTPSVAGTSSGTPAWVWIVLAAAAALLVALSLTIWKLARRSGKSAA